MNLKRWKYSIFKIFYSKDKTKDDRIESDLKNLTNYLF